jgi:hypothetical protein
MQGLRHNWKSNLNRWLPDATYILFWLPTSTPDIPLQKGSSLCSQSLSQPRACVKTDSQVNGTSRESVKGQQGLQENVGLSYTALRLDVRIDRGPVGAGRAFVDQDSCLEIVPLKAAQRVGSLSRIRGAANCWESFQPAVTPSETLLLAAWMLLSQTHSCMAASPNPSYLRARLGGLGPFTVSHPGVSARLRCLPQASYPLLHELLWCCMSARTCHAKRARSRSFPAHL